MTNSRFDIVICSGSATTRSRLVSLLDEAPGNHHVTNIGNGKENLKNFTLSAANAHLLVVAGDADNKFSTRSRQLISIAGKMGVQNFALEAGSDKSEEIHKEFEEYLEHLSGDNAMSHNGIVISDDSAELTGFLLDIISRQEKHLEVFRMPVESLSDSGHILGKVYSGKIETGDSVVLLPAAIKTKITELKSDTLAVRKVESGQAAEMLLADKIGAKPGDMICSSDNPVEVADQFETSIIWLSPEPLMAGRPYLIKSTTNTLDASITTIKHSINIDSHEHVAATRLEFGEIGVCNISLERNVPFESVDTARYTSRFTLYNKDDEKIAGMGSIHFALRRASNVHWQALDVTRSKRAELKGQKPAILWFTGLSGSGKSAIANIVEKKLTALGKHTYTLDGDNIRHGLNRDLGFTDADRVENIRRIAEVSRLMADSGIITLVSFISPFQSERQLARELAEEGEFIEIHVDTPLEVAEARDVKGLYKKARAGEIKNFTGIDSPYEPPKNPEIKVNTVDISAQDAAEDIILKLRSRGII